MLIFSPQKFSESFYLVHCPDYCIYYFKGEVGAICETGVPQINLQLKKNIQNFNINPKDVRYIIIMHSHFDHSGGVCALKEMFPQAEILGSKKTKEILDSAEEIKKIKKGISKTSLAEPYKTFVSEGASEFIEETKIKEVCDGEEINLGKGINLKIISATGHSECAISVYEKQNEVLLLSDNCGSIYPLMGDNFNLPYLSVPNDMFKKISIWPTPFYSFSQYEETQKKLSKVGAKKLGFGHFGLISEALAEKFFKVNKQITTNYKNFLLEKIKTTDSEKIVEELAKDWFADLLYFFPRFIFNWGTRATISNLIKN